jgi:hypothetical protein
MLVASHISPEGWTAKMMILKKARVDPTIRNVYGFTALDKVKQRLDTSPSSATMLAARELLVAWEQEWKSAEPMQVSKDCLPFGTCK